jgi:formate hydrogenlyase subunit 4
VFTGKMVALIFVMMIVSMSFASYFEKRKYAKLKNLFVIITLIEGIYFILAGLYMSSGQRKFEMLSL